MNIEQRIIRIVSDHLNVEKEEIKPSSSFTDDLGADSLDLIEMVMAMEEDFDITVPDEDAEKILTVQDAIDYVNRLLTIQ